MNGYGPASASPSSSISRKPLPALRSDSPSLGWAFRLIAPNISQPLPATPTPWAMDVLDSPLFWRLFLRKLSGVDSDHDAEVIRSFCDATKIPASLVIAKLRARTTTHLHRGNHSVN